MRLEQRGAPEAPTPSPSPKGEGGYARLCTKRHSR